MESRDKRRQSVAEDCLHHHLDNPPTFISEIEAHRNEEIFETNRYQVKIETNLGNTTTWRRADVAVELLPRNLHDVFEIEYELIQRVKHFNATHCASFQDVTADYSGLLKHHRELKVRCHQLDKEASELRLENDALLRSLEDLQRHSVPRESMDDLESRLSDLQLELKEAYKEKAQFAEASLGSMKQLSLVREISDKQAEELQEAHDALEKERQKLKQSKEEAAKLEAALQASIVEASRAKEEASAAEAQKAQSEKENRELVQRLVELKEKEIEKLNEMNAIREDIIEKAKKEASSLVEHAQSRARNVQEGSAVSLGLGIPPGKGIDNSSEMKANQTAQGYNQGYTARIPKTLKRSIPKAHSGGCFGLAFFHGTGRVFASCGADKTVKLWDPLSGVCTATLHGSFEGINALAFTNENTFLLGAENKQAVRVWDVATGRLRSSLTGHSGKVTGVDTNRVDAERAASCASDRSIKIWGLGKGFCLTTMLCASTPYSVVFSRDGTMLLSTHFDGALRFWDPRMGKQVHEMGGLHAGQGGGIAVGLENRTVVTSGRDNRLNVVDPRRFETVCTLSADRYSVGGHWTLPALSPNEQFVASGSSQGAVFVWDIWKQKSASGREPHVLESKNMNKSPVISCAWSPRGVPLVASDKSGGLTFWSTS